MLLNEIFNTQLVREAFVLSNGVFTEVIGEHGTAYNPFDFYEKQNIQNLYLQFASIDENDISAVKKFIENFGFLGINKKSRDAEELVKTNEYTSRLEKLLYQHKFASREEASEINQKYDELFSIRYRPVLPEETNIDKLTDSIAAIDLRSKPYEESFNDIASEILLFRWLIKLHEALSNNDVVLAKDCLTFIKKLNRYPIDLIFNNDESVKAEASFLLTGLLNRKLKDIQPKLIYRRPYQKKYQGYWDTNTLLSCMYFMFYIDITKEKIFRKCNNETCPNYFILYGNDDRKKYCSNDCARAQAQREYRKRVRNKNSPPK